MSDDEVLGDWSIDPTLRAGLRLERVRRAAEAGEWMEVMVEAEELLDEEPDHPEALLLLGEAQLELGDAEGAVPVLERHLALATPAARSLSALAVARFDHCDLPGAAEAARDAIRLEPDHAEAHYILGLSLERLPGRGAESLAEFVAAHRLDPAGFPFPLTVSEEDWHEVLEASVASLHPTLQRFWSGVSVEFHDLPDLEEIRAADPPITPRVTGMYDGDPPTEEDPWAHRPDRLRLFTGNLTRAGDVEALVERLALTLEHEALGWLGMSLEQLDVEPS